MSSNNLSNQAVPPAATVAASDASTAVPHHATTTAGVATVDSTATTTGLLSLRHRSRQYGGLGGNRGRAKMTRARLVELLDEAICIASSSALDFNSLDVAIAPRPPCATQDVGVPAPRE